MPMALQLTKQQRQAVEYSGGPLMIVAGAGTGKTTVLTQRIDWLIEQGTAAKNIVALTFTEKAATDMERRLDETLPIGQFETNISTFHGFGRMILEQFSLQSGVTEQTQTLSEAQQTLLLREHIMEFPLKTLRPLANPTQNVRAMLQFFSRCKDELITPETLLDYEDETDPDLYKELSDAYAFYQKLLQDNDSLDYGDLLCRSYYLIKKNASVQKKLREQFTHILVDEYQDTNHAQIELLRLLMSETGNVTVVGDDDQSIYRFRGAAVGQMEAFQQKFKPRIISLTENFRSNQPILDKAYDLIQHNNPHRLEVSARVSKKLTAMPEASGLGVKVMHHKTGEMEVEGIIADIQLRLEQGIHPDDLCILVRTNSQSLLFQHELERQGISYTTQSRSTLKNDQTTKLLLCFLNAVANPLDHLSLFFLATSALYNIEGSQLIPLMAEAKSQHITLESLLEPGQLLDDLRQARDIAGSQPTSELLFRWFKQHAYWRNVTEEHADQDDHIAKVLTLFFGIVKQFEQSTNNKSIFHFLESLDVLLSDFDGGTDEEIDLSAGSVKLLTVHLAKGLEFPVVYVTNLASDRFPSRDRIDSFQIPQALLSSQEPEGEHLREERRLMYVAMTRAKNDLILSYADQYGGGRIRKPSIFLQEVNLAMDEVKTFDSKPDAIKTSNVKTKPIILSPHKIDDYITCPLKYKYAHVDNLPVPDEQPLMVGQAIHAVIEYYFAQKQQKNNPPLTELNEILHKHWRGRGFISKTHELMRLEDAERQVALFTSKFEKMPVPQSTELKFTLKVGDHTLNGRIDAVFSDKNETSIIDFKTSDSVTTQEQADRRAKESLQLTLYALYWQEKHGKMPDKLGLYFTSSGLFGWTTRSARQLENAKIKIDTIAAAIQAEQFEATPSSFVCGFCPFRHFCPESMA